MKTMFTRSVAAAALALAAGAALAQSKSEVKVEGAWARPTVPGQRGGGGYLAITSKSADRLVGASSPVAQRVELHTMAMKGDVMEMREIAHVDLPAGKTVEFKPGGLHVMFMGLKEPLKVGTKVPVTLKLRKAGEVKVEFDVMLRSAVPMQQVK